MKKKTLRKPTEYVPSTTPINENIPFADVNAPLAIESNEQQASEPPIERQNKLLFGAAVASLVVIVFLSAGAWVAYQYFVGASISPTPTPAPTVVVVPSLTPAYSRVVWSLEVLNGSGIAGVAATAAQKLAVSGYQIALVGNADKTSYKGVNVYIAASMLNSRSELIIDLATLFPTATYSGELTGATTSARIIIGK